MTDSKIENVLREALEAEPPAAADLRLRAAIGLEAASRRHRRQTRRWWAAAACLAVFLGVAGLLQFQHYSARIVANDTALLEKYFADSDMLKKWSNRNEPVQYLNGARATLLPDSKSIFHMAPEDKATYKWVFDDGRELVIGERQDGTRYVQTDDRYIGTYNLANPDNPVEHAVKDVFPYAVFGNTPDDRSLANFLISM